MKIRVFRDMFNSVYRIVIDTEDWSEGDVELMERYGEPEVNVGGTVEYTHGGDRKSKDFGNEFARVMGGFPYTRGFDSRDYGSCDEAVSAGIAWKEDLISRIQSAVEGMRAKSATLPTEEVTEV